MGSDARVSAENITTSSIGVGPVSRSGCLAKICTLGWTPYEAMPATLVMMMASVLVHRSSGPPEVLPETARALLVASTEAARACQNCRKPLTGRATTACSARCRAALSRQREATARRARDQRLRSLLVVAQRTVTDAYVRSVISKALRVLDEPRSRFESPLRPRTWPSPCEASGRFRRSTRPSVDMHFDPGFVHYVH